VEVQSLKGQECIMRNPWPGRRVRLGREATPAEEVAGEILRFGTLVGETIVLTKADDGADGTHTSGSTSARPTSSISL